MNLWHTGQTARVYGEFRVTFGACIDAGCADLCPTEAMLISLAYVCILQDIWERDVHIMQTDNLKPTNFQEVTNLLLHAEHQLSYQDPKVTIAKQLRAAIEAKEQSASINKKKAGESKQTLTSGAPSTAASVATDVFDINSSLAGIYSDSDFI